MTEDSTPNSLGLPEGSGDGDTATAPVVPYRRVPPAAPSTPELARQRNRRIILAFITSILVRPLSLVIPIITVPLFLKYLGGVEGFGLYELVGSVAMYLGMTNLGLTMGLINKLTDCQVSGDRDLARRYVSTLTIAMLVIALFTAIICSVGVPLFDWRALFHVQGNFSRVLVSWALWTGGMVTVANLIATLPHSIYFAEQELHRSNLWDGACKVLTLLACVLVVKTPLGIVGVLLAVSGTPVFVRLINAIDMFAREKRWLRPSFHLFEWRLLRELLSEGLLLFMLGFSAALLFNADKMIIGFGVKDGPAAVAPYAIVGRLFIAGYGLFMALLTPMWPASGEAVRRGDIRWVRRSLRYSLLLGCGTSILVGVALLIWPDQILFRFTREHIHVSRSVILALTMTFTLRAWVDCRSITLNSTGVLKPQLLFYCGHAVLNIVLAACLVKPFGVAGVAWSTPITALLTSVWGYPWMMKKYIFSREQRDVGREMETTPC